jgi:predicted DNA-binding protein YlxM (UPF0122 family)
MTGLAKDSSHERGADAARNTSTKCQNGFCKHQDNGQNNGATKEQAPNLEWGGQAKRTEQMTASWGLKKRIFSHLGKPLLRKGGLSMHTIHANIPQNASKAKNVYRNRIELLRSRVSLLTGKDKLLMTMYLENGNSFRQMARLAGVSEASIARRIHNITKRLINGEYITCLRNRDNFTRTEMAIAKDYFLLGLSQRKIASRRDYSIYQVHKILQRIQQLTATMEKL